MFNQNNQQNQNEKNNSLFELVDNDLFVTYFFDQQQQQMQPQQHQPTGLGRSTSNPSLANFMNPYTNAPYQQPINHPEQHHLQQMQMGDRNQNWIYQDPLFGQQVNLGQPGKEENLQDHRYNKPLFGFKKEELIKPPVQKSSKQIPLSTNLNQEEMNLIKNNNDLFTYKNNLKNTYINKIQQLVSQDLKPSKSNRSLQKQSQKQKQQSVQIQEDLGKLESDGQEDDQLNTNAKLLRNRECARNSRKRKKVYIELLESKVKSLTEELDKTKRILQTSSSYFTKISQDQQLQGFFLGRQQLYEKLDKALQQGKDHTEINLLLDSMRFRVGGGGKERVSAANYFFNQILEICIPIHVRYLLCSSSQNKDLFHEPTPDQPPEDKGWYSWSLDLMKIVSINDSQKKNILRSKRKLINEKQKLEDLFTKFQDIKEQIYQKASQVENFVDELRNILTPSQTGRFLIGLEKNKYRKEMVLSKIWDIFDAQNSDMDIDCKEETSEKEEEQQPQKKVHF